MCRKIQADAESFFTFKILIKVGVPQGYVFRASLFYDGNKPTYLDRCFATLMLYFCVIPWLFGLGSQFLTLPVGNYCQRSVQWTVLIVIVCDWDGLPAYKCKAELVPRFTVINQIVENVLHINVRINNDFISYLFWHAELCHGLENWNFREMNACYK